LGRLGGLVGPDLGGRLAGLDLLLLGSRIPLPGRGYQRGVDDLPAYGQIASFAQLFREKLTKAGAIRRLFDLFDAQLRGAGQKARMDLFIRTIGMARAEAKIGLANLAYNLQRFLFHERQLASA
jgi:hypothetical protein